MSETLPENRFTEDQWKQIEHEQDTTGESLYGAAEKLGIDVTGLGTRTEHLEHSKGSGSADTLEAETEINSPIGTFRLPRTVLLMNNRDGYPDSHWDPYWNVGPSDASKLDEK